MVWQYKLSHIVMVTGVCEGGRVCECCHVVLVPVHLVVCVCVCGLQSKCEQYWEEEVGEVMYVGEADLEVTTTGTTTHRDYVIRTLNLKNVCQF